MKDKAIFARQGLKCRLLVGRRKLLATKGPQTNIKICSNFTSAPLHFIYKYIYTQQQMFSNL